MHQEEGSKQKLISKDDMSWFPMLALVFLMLLFAWSFGPAYIAISELGFGIPTGIILAISLPLILGFWTAYDYFPIVSNLFRWEMSSVETSMVVVSLCLWPITTLAYLIIAPYRVMFYYMFQPSRQ